MVQDEGAVKTRRLVFVSHSGQDTWVAKQIAREIERSGAKSFLDEAEIDAGADFEEDIRDFLDQADELVVLLTPWALERPYVWIELGAAWVVEFRLWPYCLVLLRVNYKVALAFQFY